MRENKPTRASEPGAGSPWLRDLYEQFAPVRAEAADHSEVEIDEAIDEAVEAVRRRDT